MVDRAGEAVLIDLDSVPLMPNICAGGSTPEYFWKTVAAHFGGDKQAAKEWVRAHHGYMEPLPGPAKATLVEVLGLGDRAYDAANIEAIEKAYRRGLKRNGLDLGIDDRHLVDSPGGGRLSAGSGWDQEMLQRVRDEAESRNVPAIRRLTKAWYLLTRTHPQWKRREKKSALYGETYDIFYLRRVLKNVLGISHTDPNFPTNKLDLSRGPPAAIPPTLLRSRIHGLFESMMQLTPPSAEEVAARLEQLAADFAAKKQIEKSQQQLMKKKKHEGFTFGGWKVRV